MTIVRYRWLRFEFAHSGIRRIEARCTFELSLPTLGINGECRLCNQDSISRGLPTIQRSFIGRRRYFVAACTVFVASAGVKSIDQTRRHSSVQRCSSATSCVLAVAASSRELPSTRCPLAAGVCNFVCPAIARKSSVAKSGPAQWLRVWLERQKQLLQRLSTPTLARDLNLADKDAQRQRQYRRKIPHALIICPLAAACAFFETPSSARPFPASPLSPPVYLFASARSGPVSKLVPDQGMHPR